MNKPLPSTQEILDSLQTIVSETLDRKKRLEQYAVIWRDGKPFVLGNDSSQTLEKEAWHSGKSTSR